MGIVGVILWWLGASASLDGWILFLNLISKAIKVGVVVGDVSGPIRLLPIIAIGLIYSLCERYLRPIPKYWIASVLLLILVHTSDIGSTYLSIATPHTGAWAIQTWAAQWILPAIAYSIALTYAPELLLSTAYKILFGGSK
jgi:hypothetical protein